MIYSCTVHNDQALFNSCLNHQDCHRESVSNPNMFCVLLNHFSAYLFEPPTIEKENYNYYESYDTKQYM